MVRQDHRSKEVKEMERPTWANLSDFRKSLEGLHPDVQKRIWARTKKTDPPRSIFPIVHSAK